MQILYFYYLLCIIIEILHFTIINAILHLLLYRHIILQYIYFYIR